MNHLAAVRPSGLRMRVSSRPQMGPAELSVFLFRPEMLQKWIGPGAKLCFQQGALTVLPSTDGSLTQSLVTRVSVSGESRVLTTESPETRLTISFGPGHHPDASIVRITVGQIKGPADVQMSLAFWQGALNRLVSIVHDIRRRRESPKQALIIIHGVGEQQPGQTLMSFVKGVFGDVSAPGRWVKPDTLSGSFEMRKVTIPAKPATKDHEGMPTTDVYELYWAHLILDSTVGQVVAWTGNLLKRKDVPAPLKTPVLILRGLSIGAVLGIIGIPVAGALGILVAARGGNDHAADVLKATAAGGTAVAVSAAVGGALWKLLRKPATKLFTGYLGDAARYFKARPENIARRQEIREAGVDLLERMHESGDYQRIVVAAHSLGSAIAYDILTLAWNRLRQQHEQPDTTTIDALRAVEDAAPKGEGAGTLNFIRDLQYTAWKEHRTNTQPWLVTDFVTMGSPLTYGPFLMADNDQEFSSMVADRVLPTCPPKWEDRKKKEGHEILHRFSYALRHYSIDGSRHHPFIVPDHGAMFALTRWTNLYFPKHGLIGGDPVGGPLERHFGQWIRDLPVEARKVGFMGFAHNYYWKLEGDGPGGIIEIDGKEVYDNLDCLHTALDLYTAERLRAIAKQRPAYTYL